MADQSASSELPKPAVKRKVPDSLRFADSDDEGAGEEEKDEKKLKTTFDSESFKCSICLNIWHDVVCVSPCQHNFCNFCFSEWYRKSRATRGDCKCPQCRADIMFASKNHAMASLVDDLLKNNPSLKRPTEELESMDKKAIVKSNFMKLDGSVSANAGVNQVILSGTALHRYVPTTTRFNNEEDEEEDEDEEEEAEEEEEEEEITCRQCDANSSTYRCQPGSNHLMCVDCGFDMPERTNLSVPQRCAGCNSVFCDAYWRSQNLPSSAGVTGCPSGKLQAVSERNIASFPRGVHKGNDVEQEFTKQYLTQHGLTIEGVVREWMGKVDRSEHPGPSNMQVSSTSAICNACADKVVVHLLDAFRMSIPKNEMPPEAAGRDDCWYGHACRTQRHNVNHAKKLNHMCDPTHRNVAR